MNFEINDFFQSVKAEVNSTVKIFERVQGDEYLVADEILSEREAILILYSCMLPHLCTPGQEMLIEYVMDSNLLNLPMSEIIYKFETIYKQENVNNNLMPSWYLTFN